MTAPILQQVSKQLFQSHYLRLRRYKAKGVKTRCYQEGVGQFERRFQGEGVVPGEYFFGFYKTRHILLSDIANCNVLRAVVLTQYRRVTDRQTDWNAIASTALAMRALLRALRRAVKMSRRWISLRRRRWKLPIRFYTMELSKSEADCRASGNEMRRWTSLSGAFC